MIIQERQHIGIVRAKYDTGYVNYIRKTPQEKEWPWNIDNRSHVEIPASIPLALTLTDGEDNPQHTLIPVPRCTRLPCS
jgi:hypothetical protein